MRGSGTVTSDWRREGRQIYRATPLFTGGYADPTGPFFSGWRRGPWAQTGPRGVAPRARIRGSADTARLWRRVGDPAGTPPQAEQEPAQLQRGRIVQRRGRTGKWGLRAHTKEAALLRFVAISDTLVRVLRYPIPVFCVAKSWADRGVG